ncbi:MAG: tripartite tricarboxylate transporter substrate-binding protein [Gammaproteobacteria bacterium]|nr:tripartite tricarboxylate transporter substrate-binding protein [Gammaproteobacteria bacterium]
MLKRLLTAAAGLIVAFAACPPAIAADAAFYRGKTVTYIVATDPGGGYDTYGRLIARYMQKHLPGSRFVVRNIPGAGNIIGTNMIFASRPNGLTIGMFNSGLIYNQLMDTQGIRFDLTKMSWIGKASNQIRVMVIGTNSGIGSFEEMLQATEPVKFSSPGIGSAGYLDSRILDTIFPQFDIQTIPGFDGAEGELSMIRGEVDAQVAIASSLEQFVNSGHGYFGLAMSPLAREILPDVSLAADYVTDPESHRLLGLLEALSDLGRLTSGPPGIPADLLAVLREAHAKSINDPELLAEARNINIPIDAGSGEFVESRIREVLTQTPETIALLKGAAASR